MTKSILYIYLADLLYYHIIIMDSLTFWEKAVGLTFNPSGDEKVIEIKRLYAKIIDIMYEFPEAMPSELWGLSKIAITEALTAQMWAVKAITWKY